VLYFFLSWRTFVNIMTKSRNTKTLKTFGKHLRKLRLERKLSQEKLSYLAEPISLNTISFIERGLVNPTLTNLILLSSALEIPLKELMDFE
jgi:transcriptional regulator with XRE-family HTH domain